MTPPTSTDQLITGVDFVALPTHDLEASAAFYGETLGLRRSVYMPERSYAEFETGQPHAERDRRREDGPRAPRPARTAIALHVEDVEAARKTLEARGVEFRGETLRHGRLPHGVLRGPRRQRADAPPPLRAANDGRLTAPQQPKQPARLPCPAPRGRPRRDPERSTSLRPCSSRASRPRWSTRPRRSPDASGRCRCPRGTRCSGPR